MAADDIGLSCLNEKLKPRYGLEFDAELSAHDFYNAYGRSMGFSVRKETYGRNKRTGELTSRLFVCCKEGFGVKDKQDDFTIKPIAETRIRCGAYLSIKLDREKNIFLVSHFVDEHNHPLVMLECGHMLPSQRTLSSSQAIEVDLADESEIPLKSSYELLGRQVGGRESLEYTKRDQKNYLRSKRQKILTYGEAGCLLKIFL
ncbi:hypothetical protein Dsin_016787 [Dipteronia sinensis]|uniref:FAR1 domain-containing protein n=1 Tax=Dipteronia sinensis TaxID=43782 RepID=A0AAE0ADU1_9ROSI|nr:hypothetical protein Dsin_016787 [Dipteronia sinensis]